MPSPFALGSASHIATVVLVLGCWAGLAQLASALVRPSYAAGMVTLRTATRQKRRAKLGKAVAAAWMYAIVLIAMVTSFVGAGVLLKDTADYFGFQRYVLSWEYLLHPRYVAVLCASGLAAFPAAIVRFRRCRVMNAAAYEAAHRVGFAVFMAAAAAGFAFLLWLEAGQSGGGAQGMPSGPGAARAVAVLVASRAAAAGFGGVPGTEASREAARRVAEAGVSEEDRRRLLAFVSSLPLRAGVAMGSLRERMRARGFDDDTARLASSDLREKLARASRGRILRRA